MFAVPYRFLAGRRPVFQRALPFLSLSLPLSPLSPCVPILCIYFFPRASERRVFQKEGGVNRSTYKRSSHIWHLLTSSHIWHLLTSSHIFSHLTSSDIFSHLTSSHIFSHLTSSHISHLHISLLYSFYLRRGAGPADHHERRPSAEIVRVGCAKPRRNCVCAGAWSTLCGDCACRMRETYRRNCVWRCAWSTLCGDRACRMRET